MKKSVLLALIGFAMFTLCGCREKITVKGQDGTEYESYQECCAAQDFQAAHQFLSKMENAIAEKGYGYDDLDDARKEVYRQEALFLMSQGDAAAKKRIIYLLKEYGNNDDDDDGSLIDMLIDLAIEEDDDGFVKQLANQFNHGDKARLKKIVEYLYAKDSNNKPYLTSLLKKFDQEKLLLSLSIVNNDRVFVDDYLSTHDLSFDDNELIELLAKTQNKNDSEMIIGMLVKEERKIDSKPSFGTLRCKIVDCVEQTNTAVSDTYDYKYSVSNFNGKCKTILGIAIENGNQYLAQRVITKFKQSVLIDKQEKEVEDRSGCYHYENFYTIKPDNSDINEAKKTYQEAFK